MTKVNQPGSQFGKLLEYLNSPEHLRRGYSPITTLVGKVMCKYCHRALNLGNMPRRSVANKLDAGSCPPELRDLNTFEQILLRRVNMFQSTVVLGPTGGHLKRSEKMKAMKGFCVHIPMPLEDTVSQLNDLKPGALVDPDKTIQLLGVPNKDKFVWHHLVDVNKVYRALEWFVNNNDQYADVKLPASPDEILPQFDIGEPSQQTNVVGSQDVIDFLGELGKSSSESEEKDIVPFHSDDSFLTIDECMSNSSDYTVLSEMSFEETQPSQLTVVSETSAEETQPSQLTVVSETSAEETQPSQLTVVSETSAEETQPSQLTVVSETSAEETQPSQLTVVSETSAEETQPSQLTVVSETSAEETQPSQLTVVSETSAEETQPSQLTVVSETSAEETQPSQLTVVSETSAEETQPSQLTVVSETSAEETQPSQLTVVSETSAEETQPSQLTVVSETSAEETQPSQLTVVSETSAEETQPSQLTVVSETSAEETQPSQLTVVSETSAEETQPSQLTVVSETSAEETQPSQLTVVSETSAEETQPSQLTVVSETSAEETQPSQLTVVSETSAEETQPSQLTVVSETSAEETQPSQLTVVSETSAEETQPSQLTVVSETSAEETQPSQLTVVSETSAEETQPSQLTVVSETSAEETQPSQLTVVSETSAEETQPSQLTVVSETSAEETQPSQLTVVSETSAEETQPSQLTVVSETSAEETQPSQLTVVSETSAEETQPSQLTVVGVRDVVSETSAEETQPSQLTVVSETSAEETQPSQLTVVSETSAEETQPVLLSQGGLDAEHTKEVLGRKFIHLLRRLSGYDTVCKHCANRLLLTRLHVLRLGTVLLSQNSLIQRVKKVEELLKKAERPYTVLEQKTTMCRLCHRFNGHLSVSKKVKRSKALQDENITTYKELVEARETLANMIDLFIESKYLCVDCGYNTSDQRGKGEKTVSPLTTKNSKIAATADRVVVIIGGLIDLTESSSNDQCMKCEKLIFAPELVQQHPDIAPWTRTSNSSWHELADQVDHKCTGENPDKDLNKNMLHKLCVTWESKRIRDSVCGENCTKVLDKVVKQFRRLKGGFIFKPDWLETKFLTHMLDDVVLRLDNLNSHCFLCVVSGEDDFNTIMSTSNQSSIDSTSVDSEESCSMVCGGATAVDQSSDPDNEIKEDDVVISDFSSLNTSGSSQAGADADTTEKARKLIKKMDPDDFKNRIEEMSFMNIDALLESNLDSLYEMLKVESTPLLSSDERLELLSFPELFCYGQGSLHDKRPVSLKCGPAKYTEAKLLSGDSRFRQNLQYVFYLAGEQLRRKISQSVYCALRNVHGLDKLSSGELLQKLKSNDDGIKRKITTSLRDVPGTKQYWASVKSKLRAQTEKYGPPTFFVTFSPAEYAWPELIGMLRDLNKDLPNIDSLTDSELLNKEPALTTRFIHTKFQALLEFIKKGQPLGKVKSHFVRYEYQGRGTVHFHCFLWIENAPVLGECTDEEAATFIQRVITCRLPDKNAEPELYEVVKKFQTHACRKYCLRSVKSPSLRFTLLCRFGFPFPSSRQFLLRDVLSSLIGRARNKFRKRLYDLVRSYEERNINAYNPTCILLWGGNMDIQFLSENSYTITDYVCKYMLKGEVSNINCDFSSMADTSGSAFQKYIKFAYTFLKQREMSAHEACDLMLLTGGELWSSSEKYVWVPTTLPEHRSRTLKKVSELEKNEESTEIFYRDWVHDIYPNRMKKDESLNLFRFISKYERVNRTMGTPLRVKGKEICWLKKRDKEPVIYHHQHNVKKSPELFYYSMLSLYKIWRQESDILGESKTYQEEFFRCVDSNVPEFEDLRHYSARRLDIEKARSEMQTKVEEAVKGDKAGDDNGKVTAVKSDADDEDSDGTDTNPVMDGVLDHYQQNTGQSGIKTQQELDNFVATLNKDQLDVYNKVTSWLLHMEAEHTSGTCKKKDCTGQLLLYVSGFGGTGKTYLITALTGFCFVQREVHKKDMGLLLMAPTGVAALGIGGFTCHAALSLNVQHGQTPKYTSYHGEKLHRTRQVFSDLKCVVIDEISMVSNILLFYISLRLSELFKGQPGGNQPFGGRCVILFGDLLQLQPVQAAYPFEEISSEKIQKLTGGVQFAQNIWRLFEYAELNINQRQKMTVANGQEWKELLGRLRVGGMTGDDVKLLSTRLIQLKERDDIHKCKIEVIKYYRELVKHDPRAVCLLPTKAMVGEFNDAMLECTVSKTVTIPAIDDIQPCIASKRQRIEQAIKKLDKLDDSRNTAALEQLLILGENVRVMLRRNIDLGKGLVNGSMGTIVKIHLDPISKIVHKISIKFDDIDDVQDILRDRREIMVFSGGFFFRSQFPITLSYSITIHKAQGLTLDTVLTDVGNRLFAPGQMYVCLSRVRSLAGLHLINFSPKKGIANVSALKEYVRISNNSVYMPQAPSSVFKVGKSFEQRKWWVNKGAVAKAKDGITNVVKDNIVNKPSGRPKKKVKAIKTKNKTKTTTQNTPDTNETQKIISLARRGRNANFHLEGMTSVELNILYSTIITPGLAGSLEGFHNRLAQQLNPDPFNRSRVRVKWLSDDVIQQYMWAVIDRVENSNPGYSFFSMAACFDTYRDPVCPAGEHIRELSLSELTERDFEDKILPTYINQAYMHRRWSSTRVITGTKEERMIADGDPMDKDIIALIGNPSTNHWVMTIIDNRPSHKTISYFDSGRYQRQDVAERCLYYLKGLQIYRKTISDLGVQLNPVSVNLRTHAIQDGGSVRQENSFDCGVFTLVNLELYLAGLPMTTVSPGKLPLYRANILARLLEFEALKQ
eukprot:sb/3460404/